MTATCDDQHQLKLTLAKQEPSTNGSTLHAYANVPEARASIGRYIGFYNGRRPHSSLDG